MQNNPKRRMDIITVKKQRGLVRPRDINGQK